MIKDLDAIYSGGDQDTTKPPPATPVRNLDKMDTSAPSISSGVDNLNVGDYIGYMPNGVYTDRKPVDFIRGENQSVWEQLGKRALDIIPNVAGGLMQFFGVMGSLATEWGKDDKDYNNWLVQASNDIHNFGGWGDIYRENNNVFAPSDPGWWIDNIGQLADSAIPFAIGGAGVASLLEKAAVGIGDMVNLGVNGTRLLRGAAQLGSAAYMSYAEGAQAGAQVFQGVYSKQYQKMIDNGLTPDEADKQAKIIASSSAASTVQLNTILGTALNWSSVAPFFRKSEDVAMGVLEKELGQQVGESTAKWAARVKGITADQFKNKLIEHHGLKSYLMEGIQEGSEEVMNNFTQNTGEEEGEKGNVHGFWDQFGQLEHWFDRTWDQQGALAFVLGAAGGIGNTIAVSHLPHQWTSQYADGQHQKVDRKDNLVFNKNTNEPVYQKHFASPHNIDKWGTLQAFNSVKDSLASDVDEYSGMQQRYFDAVKGNEPVALEQAKQEMFNPLVFNAVKKGMTAPWIEQFQNIGQLSPQEADQQGYAPDYKEQAQKAVSQLQEAGEEYDKLKTKYGLQWEANSGAQQVLDMVFHRKIGLMQMNNMIQQQEGDLAKSRAEEVKEAKLQNPGSYDAQADTVNRDWKTAKAVSQVLGRELELLKSAIATKDYTQVNALVRKYKAQGLFENDMPGAVKDLVGKLQDIHGKAVKQAQDSEDALLNSSGFIQYQNEHPDATFADFTKSIQKGYELNQQNLFHQIGIDYAKKQYEVAASNYREITQEKTLNRFIKKANDWQDKLVKEQQAQEAEVQTTVQSTAKDKSTLDRVSRIQLDEMAKRYRQQRDTELANAAAYGRTLEGIKEDLKQLKIYKEPSRILALKGEQKTLERQIREANAKAKYYDALNTQHAVDTSSAVVTPEAATQQAEDKDAAATVENKQVVPDGTIPLPEGETIEEATGTVSVDAEGNLTEEDTINEADADEFLAQYTDPEAYKEEMESAATVDYATELNSLTPEARTRMGVLETEIRNGDKAFSLDLLNTEVAEGSLTQPQAARILQALEKYLQQNPVPVVEEENEYTRKRKEIADVMTADEALDFALKNNTDPVLTELATAMKNGTHLQGLEAHVAKEGKNLDMVGLIGARGNYYFGGIESVRTPSVIIHEFLHHYTEDVLSESPEKLSDNDKKFVSTLKEYYKIAKEADPHGQYYGTSNVEEFASEITKDEFRRFLQRIKYEDTTLLDKVKDAIITHIENVNGHVTNSEVTTNEIMDVPVAPIVPSEPIIDTTPIEVTDSPMIHFNDDTALEQEGWRHIGKKIDDALTMANTTFGSVRDVQDKNGNIRKEVDKDKINPQYNQDLLIPGKVMPNTDVYYEVATDYEGFTKDYNSLEVNEAGDPVSTGVERFTDYVDEQGKLKNDDSSIGNFPIRIIDRSSGKTVGWVRKLDYIHAKFPNTKDYRNFVDVKFTPEGQRVDVLYEQTQRLMKLRQLIAAQHNSGSDTHIEGSTTSKKVGNIIFNRVDQFDAKGKKTGQKLVPGYARNHAKPEYSLLPDQSLELGIIHKPEGSRGAVHTRYKTPTNKDIVTDLRGFSHGAVVALLPGANGQFHAVSLSGQKLVEGERMSAVKGVTRAIELYLKNDGTDKKVTEEIERLKKNTTHDIRTAAGLKAFINQYFTYTQDFKDSQTMASGSGRESFLFSIRDANTVQSKGEIRVGWGNSGRQVVGAKLINGKLDPTFITALTSGFKTRSRAVVYTDPDSNLRGINEAGGGEFADAMFVENGSDYPWRHTKYPSYNEYVKSFSRTVAYGRNKLSNGQYNYVANPTIAFSYVDPGAFPTLPEGKEVEDQLPPVQQQAQQTDLDLLESLSNYGNAAPLEADSIPAIGTAPDNSRPLALASLQEMYNFTPEALRNGRTVPEIYDQLTRTGITWLSEGYNPFTRCL